MSFDTLCSLIFDPFLPSRLFPFMSCRNKTAQFFSFARDRVCLIFGCLV